MTESDSETEGHWRANFNLATTPWVAFGMDPWLGLGAQEI